ncbi:hypothetical protein [Bacillus safensis]|uniref:hypothetical protein n=1 Tax=Bacillus safensis TaxID=561879 RepID=UPI0012DC31AE|nr:hypothetical protein [Bacillus safensis]
MKYAVFSDYCDAGQTVYEDKDSALADYNERINRESTNGVDAYLCVVLEEYKAK